MMVSHLPLLAAITHLSRRIDELIDQQKELTETVAKLQEQVVIEYEVESSESESEESEELEESDSDSSVCSAPATFSYKVQRTQ
jgi:hypothetical protein